MRLVTSLCAGALLALSSTTAGAASVTQSGHSCRFGGGWASYAIEYDAEGVKNTSTLILSTQCPLVLDGESSSGTNRDITWARVSVLDGSDDSYSRCNLGAVTAGGGSYYSTSRQTSSGYVGPSTFQWTNPLNGGGSIGKVESLSFSCTLARNGAFPSRVYGYGVGLTPTTIDAGPPSTVTSGNHCVGFRGPDDYYTRYDWHGIRGIGGNTKEVSCPVSLAGDSSLGSARDVSWAWVVLDDADPDDSPRCDLQMRSSTGSFYYSSQKKTGASYTGTKKLFWWNPLNGGYPVSAPAVMTYRCYLPNGNVFYAPYRVGVRGYAVGEAGGTSGTIGGIALSF